MTWQEWFNDELKAGTAAQRSDAMALKGKTFSDWEIARSVFGWSFPKYKDFFKQKNIKEMELFVAARYILKWATNNPLDQTRHLLVPAKSELMNEMRDCLAYGITLGKVKTDSQKKPAELALSTLREIIRKNNEPFEPRVTIDKQLKALVALAKQFDGVDEVKVRKIRQEILLRKKLLSADHQNQYVLDRVEDILKTLKK